MYLYITEDVYSHEAYPDGPLLEGTKPTIREGSRVKPIGREYFDETWWQSIRYNNKRYEVWKSLLVARWPIQDIQSNQP